MSNYILERSNLLKRNVDFKYSIIIDSVENDKIRYFYNSNKKIKSASLIKIFIMAYLFHEVEKKNIDLNDKLKISDKKSVDGGIFSLLNNKHSIKELIVYMITISDNTATNILIDFCGIKEINKYLEENRFINTEINRKMMDFESAKKGRENYTSAFDVYRLLKNVYDEEIFNKELSSLFLEILSKQQDKKMAGYFLKDSVKFAHKTGELKGINHDVGLFIDNKTFFVVLTWGSMNFASTRRWIGEFALEVYQKIIRGVDNDNKRYSSK